MKNFPQGIFQTLDWLTKEFKKILYKVTSLETLVGSKLDYVVNDGVTLQGNGTNGDPLKSIMASQIINVSVATTSVLLSDYPTKTIFVFNADTFDPPVSNFLLTLPSTQNNNGIRLIIVNNTAVGMDLYNSTLYKFDGTSLATLNSQNIYEIISIENSWFVLSKYTI